MSTNKGNMVRPSFAWIRGKPSRFIAFGFGSGALYPGPGTWGTVMAWVLWGLLGQHASDWFIGTFLIVAFLYGCWACDQVGKELHVPDHSGMNWDEAVAFWLVLWLIPGTFVAQAIAFMLFRLFDILKPPPVRYFDESVNGGFGVMMDDIIAALYTLLIMAVVVRIGWL